jgi:hypothetical protein
MAPMCETSMVLSGAGPAATAVRGAPHTVAIDGIWTGPG